MRISLLAAAAALALGGCTSSLTGISVPRDSDVYVASAAAHSQFEVQAAELAVVQAARADVRAYAQRLIEEHGRVTRNLADAALEAGMSPPWSALTSVQQRALGELQAAPAGGFDEVYLREEIPAHEEAIRLHNAYALTGDAEPLRRIAAMAVARVHQHMVDAERLRRIDDAPAG